MFVAKSLALLAGLVSAVGDWGNSKDPSTYSNIEQANSQHVHLDITVDFPNKKFDGMVTHNMISHIDSLTEVYFDIVGIDVKSAFFRQNA